MPPPAETQMEPMFIRDEHSDMDSLRDLAWRLGQESASIASPQLSEIQGALAKLVRAMNCYYSNLIEGHNTLPIEIDRALKNQFEYDPGQRDLQEEAKAHIEVQRWIDEDDGLAEIGFGAAGVCEIHRRFYGALPHHLHFMRDSQTEQRIPIVPGAYRQREVSVGRHIPVAPDDIDRCMNRWDDCYTNLPDWKLVLATATAHHRLVWIHPMLDGNGRVARLITHAMLKKSMRGVNLWSVSRGFAQDRNRYKALLASCDHPRRGDRDGRGQLSESSLVEFTRYLLETALDQVQFMTHTLRTDTFTRDFLGWVRSNDKLAKGDKLIEHVILYGPIERGSVPEVLGMPDRSARRVVNELSKSFLLESDSTKAPLRLNIPLHAAQAVFPGMVPDNAG